MTELAVLQAEARAALDQAAAFAVNSPFPEPAELVTDVYA